jgi:chemotaxis protein CheC
MKLDPIMHDSLKELMNIAVGKGAALLNALLTKHISLKVPDVQIISREELSKVYQERPNQELAIIDLYFQGGLSGISKLVFPADSALALTRVLLGSEDFDDLDAMKAGALTEIGNIVLNSVLGLFSNMLKIEFRYSVPSYHEGSLAEVLGQEDQNQLLLARTSFDIEDLNIQGEILLSFELDSLHQFLKLLKDLQSGTE